MPSKVRKRHFCTQTTLLSLSLDVNSPAPSMVFPRPIESTKLPGYSRDIHLPIRKFAQKMQKNGSGQKYFRPYMKISSFRASAPSSYFSCVEGVLTHPAWRVHDHLRQLGWLLKQTNHFSCVRPVFFSLRQKPTESQTYTATHKFPQRHTPTLSLMDCVLLFHVSYGK